MVNKTTLIGRVGKDPIVKHFDNGGKVAEFTLATDDSYKKQDGTKVEQTDWHNIKISFAKLVEVAEKYVKKGTLLYVEGKLKTRKYQDKDGNDKYITEVVCDTMKMLSGKDDKSATVAENQKRSVEESGYTTRDGITTPSDDLPF